MKSASSAEKWATCPMAVTINPPRNVKKKKNVEARRPRLAKTTASQSVNCAGRITKRGTEDAKLSIVPRT
ncbi:hypothetical protein HPB48_017129 [Haemaphysalis longicornis]|uniref:Uncharacterized protein n=1 Tax=Haemaphysalis longicornis TaxID=44386 RepID=A0A9J6FCB9_HAELO|nr:hypothetical protein HPB48_017129 [Haemaphysalis longicornis]